MPLVSHWVQLPDIRNRLVNAAHRPRSEDLLNPEERSCANKDLCTPLRQVFIDANCVAWGLMVSSQSLHWMIDYITTLERRSTANRATRRRYFLISLTRNSESCKDITFGDLQLKLAPAEADHSTFSDAVRFRRYLVSDIINKTFAINNDRSSDGVRYARGLQWFPMKHKSAYDVFDEA